MRLCTDAILAIVESIDPPWLLADLSVVDVINSQCLGGLIMLGAHLRAAGGGLVLLNCNRSVREVLEPLPRKQQMNPNSCPMFVADDNDEALRWLDYARSACRNGSES